MSHHHLNVKWSEEDQQWVGTCDEYPSLSFLADTPEAAGDGISELAFITRDDIAAGRELAQAEIGSGDQQ